MEPLILPLSWLKFCLCYLAGEGDVPPADASAATAPPPSITTQPPSRSLVLAGRLLRLIKDRVEVQEAKLWLQVWGRLLDHKWRVGYLSVL